MEKKRDERLDIIRIFALICVISVHFFLNSGFYDENVYGEKMLVMCILRSFFIICVPMFITLTGYLMNKKQLNLKYYKGIVKILVIYFMCSLIYAIFQKFYLKENVDIIIFLENLLSFKGTRYSWYIEMYIGLFLLIPFLNLIFNNLKDKKQAKCLLFTLIFIIGIPCILNIFNFDSADWWQNPSMSNKYTKLVPSWWTSIYPIFYYFLGAYLSKYEIKLNTKWNLILLITILILDGGFNFYRSYNNKFIWEVWNNYSSATIMLLTFLMFNLLLKIKFKYESKIRNNILKILSDACLGAYLISCIFDKIYYNKLKLIIPMVQDRFLYAPIMILAVLCSSILLSIIINIIVEKITKK